MTRTEIFAAGFGTILGVVFGVAVGCLLVGGDREDVLSIIFLGGPMCWLGWKRGRALGHEELRRKLLPHAEKIDSILNRNKVQP